MNYLAPSILAADFSILGNEITTAVNAGVSIIHLDVMDGKFVPNISIGIPVISSVRKVTDAMFDVHLMIEEPSRYIEEFHKAGADNITVHYEACTDVEKTIAQIKGMGIKAGLSISPDTPVDVVRPFITQVDMILMMSVYPGFGGQRFIEASLNRIQAVRTMADEMNRNDLWIEVDGGIDAETITKVMNAGANVFVAGSAVFKGDITKNVESLNAIIQS